MRDGAGAFQIAWQPGWRTWIVEIPYRMIVNFIDFATTGVDPQFVNDLEQKRRCLKGGSDVSVGFTEPAQSGART